MPNLPEAAHRRHAPCYRKVEIALNPLARRMTSAAKPDVSEPQPQCVDASDSGGRVEHGRTSHRQHPIKKFLKILGPGLITGASDDDPSGIGTYAMAGARLGYFLLGLPVLPVSVMTPGRFSGATVGMVEGPA